MNTPPPFGALESHQIQVHFDAHVALLRGFLQHRSAIVERIQTLLNDQQKPASALQHHVPLARRFEDCFFAPQEITAEQSALRGQLQQAHWGQGFRPREMPGIPNEMFDPADLMERAFTVWRHTRWPGRNGRVRYAHTLFNLYLVRCVTLLTMRVCDAGPDSASRRLADLQGVLAALWKSSPTDQPVLVRDARWLVPVAQSPTTDALAPYFAAAQQFEECLPAPDSLEIHKASVLMAGGHLRSQLRHFTMQGRALDETALVLSTRRSNALDCAMTIQHLVPLLTAYERSIELREAARRRELAATILQGLSADPELYVNQLDLLAAYSMIEHLFATIGNPEGPQLSPMGQRHAGLVRQYRTLIERLAEPLHEDCPQFRPQPGHYSPYGVMYGFSSNILEHMTLKALQPEAECRFSLEDVFADQGQGEQRLAWVSGWRRLPHVPPDVQKLYEYPGSFAEQIFARVEQALQTRARPEVDIPVRPGKLFLGNAGVAGLPPGMRLSADPTLVAAGEATSCASQRLLEDRLEGMHLVSYESAGGWVAITKDVLTALLGSGQDVQIEGLPPRAAQIVELLYPQFAECPTDRLTKISAG